MINVTLNNGLPVPIVGFGISQIPDPVECERSVVDAIDAGCRLIDTAASYLNEEAAGRGVRASGVALAKSVRKERMAENLDIFDLELEDDDMARIATLETDQSAFFPHRDPAIVNWMAERKVDI